MIEVICYSGYRGEETPRAIRFATQTIGIRKILDRWLAPDHRYFKILGDDDAIYIIRHEVASWTWELTFYKEQLKEIAENPDTKVKSLDDGVSSMESERLFDLAGTLAQLYDDYQVYRPEMLLAWQEEEDQDLQGDRLDVAVVAGGEPEGDRHRRIAARCAGQNNRQGGE